MMAIPTGLRTFRWIAGAKKAIRKLNDTGYLVFIVTNQAGIARGYYDAASGGGTPISGCRVNWPVSAPTSTIFAYCPHHPDGTVPELAIVCDCRKPNTGMLKSLIQQWHPDLSRSFMLGDSDKDAQAGAAAGVRSKKIQPSLILDEVEQLIAEF